MTYDVAWQQYWFCTLYVSCLDVSQCYSIENGIKYKFYIKVLHGFRTVFVIKDDHAKSKSHV